MADNGHAVTLIDAGGQGIDANGPDLHGGSIVRSVDASDRTDSSLVGGTLYARDHLTATRWRHPGGSSWRWWVRSRPSAERTVRMVEAHPTDLGPRPAFDIPGFPMPAEEVLRYREEAFAFLDLAGHSFEPADYVDGLHPAPLPDHFYDKLFHFPRVAVVQDVRPAQAAAHPLIDLRTGLHLRRFGRTGQRITELEFIDGSGSTVTLRPETVVLAMGGIENSRQLLLGARDGSIPNPHDLLGRYFMDHPHIRLGYLHQASVEELDYYDFQQIRDTYVLRGHGIDPDFADQEDLLRFSIDLVGRHALDGTRTGFALAELQDGLTRRDPALIARSARRALGHPLNALRLGRLASQGRVHHTGFGGWSDTGSRQLPVGVAAVESMFEQRPSPDNRVRLSDATDRYGVPLPDLQWSFSEVEVSAIHRAVEVTSTAFEAAGLGPLTTLRELGEGVIPRAGTGLHHMGGTRMHGDPTQGVVDENARIHDLDNVYIAGSSVFPTSAGYANPTFTIIELALRLADHLSGQPGPTMGSTSSVSAG
jgi:choline dehydrogenase-like flavoprotein